MKFEDNLGERRSMIPKEPSRASVLLFVIPRAFWKARHKIIYIVTFASSSSDPQYMFALKNRTPDST